MVQINTVSFSSAFNTIANTETGRGRVSLSDDGKPVSLDGQKTRRILSGEAKESNALIRMAFGHFLKEKVSEYRENVSGLSEGGRNGNNLQLKTQLDNVTKNIDRMIDKLVNSKKDLGFEEIRETHDTIASLVNEEFDKVEKHQQSLNDAFKKDFGLGVEKTENTPIRNAEIKDGQQYTKEQIQGFIVTI